MHSENFNPQKIPTTCTVVIRSIKVDILNASAHPVDKIQNNLIFVSQNYRGSRSIEIVYHTIPFSFEISPKLPLSPKTP